MPSLQSLQQRIDRYQQDNLQRQRHVVGQRQGVRCIVDSRSCINFCSFDYLSLTSHPTIIQAAQQGLAEYGLGSGGSQLVSGYFDIHQQVEQAFAKFLSRDRAILFGSGYLANLAVINSIASQDRMIFADKHVHASLQDGLRMSSAKFKRYRHHDVHHLVKLLAQYDQQNKYIISEGIFSMDGSLSDLRGLAQCASEHDACLVVDDAHGIGILGENGGGTLEQLGLSQQQVPLLICPLGKAFACYGAIVAGSDLMIEQLLQFGRTHIYSTAMPPALAAAILASLTIVQTEGWRREQLKEHIAYFKAGARARNLQLLPSSSAIQNFIIGDNAQAMAIHHDLWEKGYWLMLARPPTVAKGYAGLRITLNYLHTPADIDGLLNHLAIAYERVCNNHL